MTQYRYAKEKLGQAIYLLCIEPGDVRSRLYAAYMVCHTLREKDFPSELQSDWISIYSQLTKFTPIRKVDIELYGRVGYTLRKIRNSTGTKIAKMLYNLYIELKNF